MKKSIDRRLLLIIIILTVGGFFIFSSASLGLLAKDSVKYSNVIFSQTFFGVFLGTVAAIALSRTSYEKFRNWALWFFLGSLLLCLCVFIPGLGMTHNGATRWIVIFGQSFQPSELLKISSVMMLAAWISAIKDKVKTFKYGTLPLMVVIALCGIVLLAQPDTDTFVIIVAALGAIYLVGQGRWRDIAVLALIGILGISVLAATRPYIKNRLATFINPSANSLGAGFQIQQSLIAVGSGGLYGRGFGQSIQKFTYLPEPIGDSVFAVAAEEFGFVGASAIVLAFVAFGVQGLKVASRVEDVFGKLLAVGIVVLVMAQAFVNIGSMIGLVPLAGVPLPFISHGGTALCALLAQMGILLSISRNASKKVK